MDAWPQNRDLGLELNSKFSLVLCPKHFLGRYCDRSGKKKMEGERWVFLRKVLSNEGIPQAGNRENVNFLKLEKLGFP